MFAVMVATMHLLAAGHQYDWKLVRASYLAVDFFFVLSGFVIAHASANKLQGGGDVVRFAVRRFARVWPLHAVVLLAFVVLELCKLALSTRGLQGAQPPFAAGAEHDPLAILAHLALLHSFGLFSCVTWNVPSWSIGAEFYTYLVFAISALWMRNSIRATLAWSVLGAVVLYVCVPHMNVTYDYGFPRCLYGFFVGVLVQRAYSLLPGLSARWGTLAEVACLLLVVGFLHSVGETRWSLLAPLVFVLPIWVFAWEHGALSWTLKRPVLQALGRWSYAIYMVHEFFYEASYRLAHLTERRLGTPLFVGRGLSSAGVPWKVLSFGGPWLMDLFVLAMLTLVIAVAALAHRYVELPAQRYLQRRNTTLTSNSKGATVVAAAAPDSI